MWSTLSSEWPCQTPSLGATLSSSASSHHCSELCLWASVLCLVLFCGSMNKMCPEVIASSPYATSAYKRFHRNTLLSVAGEIFTGRTLLLWRFYDLFWGEGQGEGQSDLPVSAVFSNSFSLKYSICQGAIFWGSMSWTRNRHGSCCTGAHILLGC